MIHASLCFLAAALTGNSVRAAFKFVLQDALNDYDITADLAPNWIPDGYELFDVQTQDTDEQKQIVAAYSNGNQIITVQIKDFLGWSPEQIEQSGAQAEVYRAGGIDYYIFSDGDRRNIAWINEGFECFISGQLTVKEAQRMLDSITEG